MLLAAAHWIASSGSGHGLVYRPSPCPGTPACWLALPREVSGESSPIVAVHGIRRNAGQQAELFARRATETGRPVIAPLFERSRWPRYQQVVRRGRADLALLALMAQLRRDGIWRTPQFELFGFSGGAQFAHRFAMIHPELVSRLTAASAGWYTFPDPVRFPYGLASRQDPADPWSAVTEEKFRRFLSIPLQVCVGTNDNTADRNTRSGAKIDAQQGTNRLARATRWADALRNAARVRGMVPRTRFLALAGCGHDFRQCVIDGALDRLVIPDEAETPASGLETGRLGARGRDQMHDVLEAAS